MGIAVRNPGPQTFRSYPHTSCVPVPAGSQASCAPALRRRLSTLGRAPYLRDSQRPRARPWRVAGTLQCWVPSNSLRRTWP